MRENNTVKTTLFSKCLKQWKWCNFLLVLRIRIKSCAGSGSVSKFGLDPEPDPILNVFSQILDQDPDHNYTDQQHWCQGLRITKVFPLGSSIGSGNHTWMMIHVCGGPRLSPLPPSWFPQPAGREGSPGPGGGNNCSFAFSRLSIMQIGLPTGPPQGYGGILEIEQTSEN